MRAFARTTFKAPLLCIGLMGLGVASKATADAPVTARADFGATAAAPEVRRFADWVVASGDSERMPFVIIDKKNAKVFVFYPSGRLRGAGPALLGLARGDESVPGIGQRKLASIRPEERTTPSGRFVSSQGNDLGEKDVIWVDYDAAISMHRVITTNPKERRLQRLATASARDNRITYGCINVPAKFYDSVIQPTFTGASGIVYILPEVRSMQAIFPRYHSVGQAAKAAGPTSAAPAR